MIYELYLNKSVMFKRRKDGEGLPVNMEGAGDWSMPPKLRDLPCKGPVAGTLVCLRK